MLLLAAGLYAALDPSPAGDLWWTLASGRWIVQNHSVPDHDVLSFTYDGAPWFNQEWLAQVLFFEVFQSLGPVCLVILRVGLVTFLILFVAWIGRRRCASVYPAVWVAALTALVCRPFLEIRPQLFTFLGAAALVAITDAYRRGSPSRILVFLPLLLLAWVNLHYGFIYGLGALWLVAVSEGVQSWVLPTRAALTRPRAAALLATAVASTLVCLLNPQHVYALTFPFSILQSGNPWKSVLEWQPTRLFLEQDFNPAIFGYFLVAQGVAVLLAAVTAPRRIDLTSTALVLVTGAMALSARRFIPLFAFVSAPFLAANLEVVRQRFSTRRSSGGAFGPRRTALVAAGAALLGTVGFAWGQARQAPPIVEQGLFDGTTGATFFPRDAVAFLELNPLPGRVANLYHWGGYMMYWLPNAKVFIDGRAHTVYPPDFYLENQQLLYGEEGSLAILDRHQIELVLWPSMATSHFRALRERLQQSSNWKCVYADSVAALFAHVERGRVWLDRFERSGFRVPDTANAQLGVFNPLYATGRFDLAQKRLRDAVRRFPQLRPSIEATRTQLRSRLGSSADGETWLRAGFLSQGLGDDAEARDAYRQALALGVRSEHSDFLRASLERVR